MATEVVPEPEQARLGLAGRFALVLEHERIPFVSYPYEWTFSMLQDAAVLHLDLLLAALEAGAGMKDGYAFNVQWKGTRPVFIDLPSFEAGAGSGPWAGYRQFCQTFLYPLMLQAHKDVSFQPFLRGQVDGLTPAQMRNLLDGRDRYRRGVFRHVHLHRAIEQRFGKSSTRSVERELKDAGFGAELTRAVARKLRTLVERLRWKRASSTWSDYQRTCTYTDADREAKAAFVGRVTGSRRRDVVVDLGCNEGTYARLAADHAGLVVAVDADDLVVDHLYRALRDQGVANVLPLVMNLLDPSPGLGWRGRERASFADRVRPDLVMALALVHHLAVAGNVPLAEVVDWLRSFDAEVVVELVDREDPMARRLLANKPAGVHDDYGLETFERLLGGAFDVVDREQLPSGTRTIFHAVPRR
ncbi:MAG: class I SAM-dependent methyltransferase [Acidimicrobiia bacterium]|nr:class I SAM-dependent methyltransferase [Acidimicrobiia bacterium]